MLDYRRTIDDIQSILYSGGELAREALAELAGSYLVASQLANERLRTCQELLRRGLRAEALQRCEVEPNLLDLVAALDFPERPQWCDLLRKSNLPVPPELLIEGAADLNAAYGQEQPLTAMMRRHRLLALARAPLRDRIQVLRHIRKADQANPVWEEDLKTYERARHQQIEMAVATAERGGDFESLLTLEREVQDGGWLEPPAGTLVRDASRATARARQNRSLDALKSLAPRIAAAESKLDHSLCSALVAQWREHAEVAALSENHPLAEAVASSIAWVEAEDERVAQREAYASSIATLERALDDEASQSELERLHGWVAQFDAGVPEALEVRYRSRMASLSLAAARRAKLLLVGTVGSLLLLAGLTGVVIAWQMRANQVDNLTMAMRQLLDDEKVHEADEYWRKLEASDTEVVTEPALLEQKARLDGMQRKESDRRSEFSAAVSMVRQSGFDKPNAAALAEAERLARLDSERNELVDLKTRIAQRQSEMQAERDQSFLERIEAISPALKRIDSGDLLGFATRLDAVADLLQKVRQTEREADGVSEQVKGNLLGIKAKLEGWQKSELEEERKQTQLRRITALVNEPQAFRDGLLEYAKAHPGTGRAEDFSRAAQELPLWEAVAEWDGLVRAWSDDNHTRLTPKEAADQIAAAEALLAKHPRFAGTDSVRERLTYLKPIANRDGTGGNLVDALSAPLSHSLVARLYVVKTKTGQRYYCRDKPPDGDPLNVKYIADPDPSKPVKTKLLRGEQVEFKGIAPQSQASADALEQLSRLTHDKWELTFYRILKNIYDNQQMDPIVKVQLMSVVLENACKGSYSLQQAFARPLTRLTAIPVDGVNWVAPDDAKAAQSRAEVQRVLDAFDDGDLDLVDAVKRAGNLNRKLAQPPFAERLEWVGWLHRDTAGNWQCPVTLTADDNSATLAVLLPKAAPAAAASAADSAPEVIDIGRFEKGKVTISKDPAKHLLEGRPVYRKVPTGDDKAVAQGSARPTP